MAGPATKRKPPPSGAQFRFNPIPAADLLAGKAPRRLLACADRAFESSERVRDSAPVFVVKLRSWEAGLDEYLLLASRKAFPKASGQSTLLKRRRSIGACSAAAAGAARAVRIAPTAARGRIWPGRWRRRGRRWRRGRRRLHRGRRRGRLLVGLGVDWGGLRVGLLAVVVSTVGAAVPVGSATAAASCVAAARRAAWRAPRRGVLARRRPPAPWKAPRRRVHSPPEPALCPPAKR